MKLAVDTETTGTDFEHGCRPFMVTACDGRSNYIWKGEVNPYNRAEVWWDPHDIKDIQEILDSADLLLYHNAKFDVRALSTINIRSNYWDKIEDTLIASHVVCSGETHKLNYLAFKYLDYYNDTEHLLDRAVQNARAQFKDEYDIARADHPCFPGLKGPGTKWYKMDMWLCMEECEAYGCTDVEMTWLLWQMFEEVIEEEGLIEQYKTRMALLPITYNMEEVGLNIYHEDVSREIKMLQAYKETFRRKIEEEIALQHVLDLNNEHHVRRLLFEILKLPVLERTEKTQQPSVAKDVIEQYIAQHPDNEVLQHFSQYRQCTTKIGYLNSYLRCVCEDGRIRSNFLITGTRETRQSSNSPNVQNVDKKLRHIFGPPPGKVWVDFDLVNIELRIWTYEVGNKELIDIFESGGSVHMLIAGIIHPELVAKCEEEGVEFKEEYEASWYQWTKNGNFSIIYGASPKKADRTYKKEGCYDKIARRFPEVPAYTAKTVEEAWRNDERKAAPFVTCVGGYRLDVDMAEPFKACNYKIQGSAGYIINESMIEVVNNEDYINSEARIVNQVHDSIVIEVDEQRNTEQFRESIRGSIEAGGLKYLPTCGASYKIVEPKAVPV